MVKHKQQSHCRACKARKWSKAVTWKRRCKGEFSVCKSVNRFCFLVISTPSANEVSASLCPSDACWRQLTTLRVPVMTSVVTILRGGSSVLWSDFVASQQFILTTYRHGRVLVVNYRPALRNSTLRLLFPNNTSALWCWSTYATLWREMPTTQDSAAQRTTEEKKPARPDSDGDPVSTRRLC